MVAVMKHMASNFAKLDNSEEVDFRRWQKKMHFLLFSMSVVYVLTTPMPEDGGDNPTVEQDTLEAKYMAEDASSKKFLVSNFINYKMIDSRPVLEYNELLGILGRFTQHKMNMDESIQEELTLVELGSHLRIEESLRVQDSDKPKGNNVVGPSVVNMVEHNNSFRYNDNKGKHKYHDTKADPNKKPKVTCFAKVEKLAIKPMVYYVTYISEAYYVEDDDVAWLVDSRARVHVCKDRCWFKTYESLNDGSILHMENESTALPCAGTLNIVNDNIASAFMSTSKLNDSILWHARLGHIHFKRMQDMFKDGLISAFDIDTEKCKTCMLNKITKKPFQNVKRETEVLELIHSDLCDLHDTLSLGNKKYFVTYIDVASRAESRVLRAVVRLPDPKLKTLGEIGIECIFFGYAEHSKAFRFYVIEPNDSVAINSIIESRDGTFDENRFSSVSRPSQRSLVNGTEHIGGSVVPEKVTDEVVQQPKPELKKSKRHRTPKDFGPEFQLYLIEGTRDERVMYLTNTPIALILRITPKHLMKQ
ncbi:zinc finger, CCHC-type containing protein [Tanacetum coccineum]